jgi:PhoH-like ATPase
MAQEKLYLLDTNVLIHDSQALFNFGTNIVGIPFVVLEELDQFKKETTDRGLAAREAIRQLDRLRERGFLGDGVSLDNGGTLQIFFTPQNQELPYMPLMVDLADNDIIMTALLLKNKGVDVRFISKDLNARVKADVLGIPSEDYLKGGVAEKEVYKGWTTLEVPSIQLKKDEPEELADLLKIQDLAPNEFVFLQARNNPFNHRIFRYLGGKRFKPVLSPRLQWSIEARNPQQLMALDLLLDPNIKMICLIGAAGTGKTFLALLAGLHQVFNDSYQRILVSRPVIPLGPDIGYLPGDIQEKLRSWMQPIYDNVELLMHAVQASNHLGQAMVPEKGKAKKRWKGSGVHDEFSQGNLRPMERLIEDGKISLEAITYMRGRSIPYQYILIDEVQNLNPHEVKTIISRVGEGSKIVLAGDPYQIDSPYLDFQSNGLVVANNKFKGQQLFGSVFLETSERSELSKLAGVLL